MGLQSASAETMQKEILKIQPEIITKMRDRNAISLVNIGLIRVVEVKCFVGSVYKKGSIGKL